MRDRKKLIGTKWRKKRGRMCEREGQGERVNERERERKCVCV